MRFALDFLEFQISRAPPCLFLSSLMDNNDVIARLDVLKIEDCVNLEI